MDEHRTCGPTTASRSLPLGEARAPPRAHEAPEPRANRQQWSSDGHTVAGIRALATASQPEVPDRASERDAMSAPAQSSPEQTVSELFDAFDRLDIDSAEPLFDDEPQGVDELSGGWRRGCEALHDNFAQITSAGLADVRSPLADVHTADWGDTAVVTARLWLQGVNDGIVFERRLWFSDTYVRRPAGWRYALGQASLPLPAE